MFWPQYLETIGQGGSWRQGWKMGQFQAHFFFPFSTPLGGYVASLCTYILASC